MNGEGRGASAARAAATALFVATVLAAFVSLILALATRSAPVDVYGFRGIDSLLGIPVVTIGALIVRRRSRNPIGWLFLGGGFVATALSGLPAE